MIDFLIISHCKSCSFTKIYLLALYAVCKLLRNETSFLNGNNRIHKGLQVFVALKLKDLRLRKKKI